MQVWLNDNPVNYKASISLSQLLEDQNLFRSGIAIAVNQIIIPASCWANHNLQDNDRILVFQAIAGG